MPLPTLKLKATTTIIYKTANVGVATVNILEKGSIVDALIGNSSSIGRESPTPHDGDGRRRWPQSTYKAVAAHNLRVGNVRIDIKRKRRSLSPRKGCTVEI